ncbi:hypothetical protein F7725_000071 [Dissostichus mawsoni]|uniref:Uncharacterized protein n=1 Tax=Dissostichus mawsoni TaxID=36200 RepID=A0A7J5ZDW2_DISMA|nr:hypothetical protein F7725_000071 [Dissostichus mawsoni]
MGESRTTPWYGPAKSAMKKAEKRQTTVTPSLKQLRQLVTFWVGWDVPMKGMQMHVVKGDFQNTCQHYEFIIFFLMMSSTCFLTLRLPGHHESYLDFAAQLEQCIATNETGTAKASCLGKALHTTSTGSPTKAIGH